MLASFRSPRAFCVLAIMVGGTIGALHCGDDDGGNVDPNGDASSNGDGTTNPDGATNNGDGSSDPDGGDGGPKPPRCDPNKPFGTPMMLLENSFRIDQGARLSPDELTLYFAGYGHDGVNGQAELWVAKRASVNVPFKTPTKIAELSSPDDSELYPTVTADGLTIYYQGKLGDAGYGVIKATRANINAPWQNLELLKIDLSMIYVTPDGTRLYGSKDQPGGPPYRADIAYVDLPFDGGPSKVVLGGSGLKYWPVLTPDQLTMYWSYPMILPYRWEMGVSKRSALSDAFDAATKVTELDDDSGSVDEDPTWISPDNCTIYFRRVNGNIPNNNSGLLQATRGL